MRALLIAEKPSLMRTVKEAYLKNRSKITDDIDFLAQAGHIIGLKTPKELNKEKYGIWSLDTIPEIYPYEYRVNEGKENLLQEIKRSLDSGNYDYVIHAGDPDGEGELLIAETLEYLGNELPVKRFWSNDLTESAIVNALLNMKDDCIYRPIYDAALTRQHADFQFGMNVTSGASLRLGDLCKLGRVKAPIISIIVQRELELENYVEKKSYKPAFHYKDCEFVLDTAYDTEDEAVKHLPDADCAKVLDVDVKKKTTKPPKLFKLSTLQVEAHKQLKWAAAKTLNVLQTLYEAKATSYPRSACEYISSNEDIGGIAKKVLQEGVFLPDMSLLTKDPSDVQKDKTYCNDKAIASEGHTAIIPTGEGLPANATPDQKALYEIICRRFIAMFTTSKETQTTKVTASPKGTEDVYEFSETVDLVVGFETILNPKYEQRHGKGVAFQKGMELNPISLHAKECKTKPPSRYNDGSLIKTLDNPAAYEDEEGDKTKFKIGTEATRANIIEECIQNGYFTKEKSQFYATEKAKIVYNAFKTIPLFDIQESGRWESLFEKIRHSEMQGDQVEHELLNQMKFSVSAIKNMEIGQKIKKESKESEELGKCPKCGESVATGKYGAYCKGKCGINLSKAFGKTLTDTQLKSILNGKKTLVKGIPKKDDNKKTYDAYLTKEGVSSYEYNGKTYYSIKYHMEPAFKTKKGGK